MLPTEPRSLGAAPYWRQLHIVKVTSYYAIVDTLSIIVYGIRCAIL